MRFTLYDEPGPDDEEQRPDRDQEAREQLARERRKRADISLYGLPPFVTPTYAELRKLYRRYRHDPDVRRLILEIQCARYSFSELSALAAEIHWDVSKEHASLEEARKAFARLRHRLRREIERIGQIHARQ